MKKKKEKLAIAAIAVFVALFVGLSFLIDTSGSKPEKKEEPTLSVYDWLADTQTEDYIITVLALTTCQYFQAYKPVITKVAEDYDLKLYFYETDKLDNADHSILTTSYTLPNYEGYVPYTFILKDGEVVGDQTGYNDEETTIQLLREAGAIKD